MKPRCRALAVLLVVAVPVVFVLVVSAILVDVWWFSELGQLSVYWRVLTAELLLGGGTGVCVALMLLSNAWLAVRRSPECRVGRRVVVAGCAVIGAVLGWRAERRWPMLLLWLHRQRFGVVDPVHHRDIGFFVFTLPLLQWLVHQLVVLALLSLLVTAAIYWRSGALRLRPPDAVAAARAHLSVIGSLLLVTFAAQVYLGTFTIEFQQPQARDKQPFAGAHFVDVRAALPGLQILSAVLAAGAVTLLVAGMAGTRYRCPSGRTAVTIPLVLVATTILTQTGVPALVQQLAVNPDPFAAEQPFLARSIEATRAAFGLGDVESHEERTARTTGAVPHAPISKLRRVQLWDTSVVAGQMRQLASTIPYFRPADPSLELVPGSNARVVLLAERELDLAAVPRAGNGWVNDRLAYTHGFGAFQFSAAAENAQGGPTPMSSPAHLRQPRIYFGHLGAGSPSWVVADTRRPEVDPGGATYHYRGDGGIPLSSWLRRAAFALSLHDSTVLFTREISSTSRLILHRDVVQRLGTLAPFLTWDRRPMPVIAAGRMFFLADGYTTTDYYPYAQRARLGTSTTSYARAAVTASVDAYSGQVRIYVVDTTDPILRAWRAAFPTLFASLATMPAALRAERRYPPDLFDAQATLYAQFHVSSPAVFASQADAWAAPTSLSGPIQTAGDIRFDGTGAANSRYSLRPSYRFAEPPGRHGWHVLRSALYCPYGAQNLAATLDGWIGHDGQPHLDVGHITGRHSTPGPAQISRIVLLTPQVAGALDIRNRELRDLGRSSLDSLALGAPHLLFLAGDEVQVQAVYDVASGGGIVRRRFVTIYTDGHAAIGPTLNVALRTAMMGRTPKAALPAHAVRPSR